MRNYLTEFIGTFFLVLTVGAHRGERDPLAPLAIGSALMVMVYMGGHVSGAPLQPGGVARRAAARQDELSRRVPRLRGSQMAGAFVAALVVYGVLGKSFVPRPAEQASLMAALVIEILFTFALALVVLNSAASAKTHGNSFYGLAIGFTIVVAAFAGGPGLGGAFNPAVGPGAGPGARAGRSRRRGHVWLYLVGPLAGGALAAVVFGLQEREPLQLHAEPSKTPESRPA